MISKMYDKNPIVKKGKNACLSPLPKKIFLMGSFFCIPSTTQYPINGIVANKYTKAGTSAESDPKQNILLEIVDIKGDAKKQTNRALASALPKNILLLTNKRVIALPTTKAIASGTTLCPRQFARYIPNNPNISKLLGYTGTVFDFASS